MDTTSNHFRSEKLCIFCYKPGLDNKLGSRLLQLLSRYVEIPVNSSGEKKSEYQVVCEGCAKLGESFCDLYFQLEAIKLKLDWKVNKFCDRMVHAGKVPARGVAFKQQFEKEENRSQGDLGPYHNIQRMRRRLVKNCKRKLKANQPRVILKKIDVDKRTDDGDEVQFPISPLQHSLEIKEEPEQDPLETNSFETENYPEQESEMEFDEAEIKVEIVQLNLEGETETDPLDISTPVLWSINNNSLADTLSERISSTSSPALSTSTGTSWIAPTQCETCSESFSSEAAVEKHRVLVHNLKNYVRCPICFEMFPGYSFYRLHRTKQGTQLSKCFTSDWSSLIPAAAPEYPYVTGGLSGGHYFCTFEGCNEVFQYEQRLQIHLGTHGEWKCLCCGITFEKGHHLAWHELKIERNLPGMPHQPQKQKKYECTRCSRTFEQNLSMTNHFLKEHLDIPLNPRDKMVKKGARVQCLFCKKTVPKIKIMMAKHVQSEHQV